MTEQILQYLKLGKSAPSLIYLQQIIAAYCQTVPWESVSRIVKKNAEPKPESCLRLEKEFWMSAFQYGTGGTCYESNWALFKLLQTLGYDGYLTINKVADKSSYHSAIVVLIEGRKYIADVGYPLYAPVMIEAEKNTLTESTLINYQSTAISGNEYIIENRPHPKPYLFHLKDEPVSDAHYLKIATEDYGDAGLFLDRMVVRKVIDNVATRFDSADLPYNIHQLQQGSKTRNYIQPAAIIASLQTHFGIDATLLQQAFAILNLPYQ